MPNACSIRVRGVVQGVGFRPFVYRLARSNTLAGWVRNGEEGVEIYLEGADHALRAFVEELKAQAPPAASIADIEIHPETPAGLHDFTIRGSQRSEAPSVRISPDLPVCDECLKELFDSADRRFGYPYINCSNCGPRYSVILSLPYDRPHTTMKDWPLDSYCEREYRDPGNRRFHAQPVACPGCGPGYNLQFSNENFSDPAVVKKNRSCIRESAQLLTSGNIVAVKGLGGYHLACDASNPAVVAALRERKYRKEKPFAIMARDLETARSLVELSLESEKLLASTARPIVLASAKVELEEVAPGNNELGVMLPYTPLQHLLFAAGAPPVLVMTSANRSSEPIAYEDEDALTGLSGIADAFLIGQRPIARRVDDSVVRAGTFGPAILRRSRGYAPGAVANLPIERPLLAVGADLKNTVTLVVGGQAFVSQHIGDLSHFQAFRAFEETIRDLVSMYEVKWENLTVAYDAHPQYASTSHALALPAATKHAIQHHRAHIASVLAEHGAWQKRVVGVSCDGTGYGDDGSIWGGEIFMGSVRDGFQRVAHLRNALLPGGDAAAQNPVQAAAGFLTQIEDLPDLTAPPFNFPNRYRQSMELVRKQVRTFPTTSVGRLFDTAAALLGFTREISFEGQAAIWLEQVARSAANQAPYPFPFVDNELDFRPLLQSLVEDRKRGRDLPEIARAFQRAIAEGLCACVRSVCGSWNTETVVLSGGVFQNELLLEDLKRTLRESMTVWVNHAVPANDGGISLGQAALAAFNHSG